MLVSFLNSNFFLALTTLVVGGFAIYLYLKQKKDKKRDAARLILQEIRYAEQQIRKYREFKQYQLSDRLLPTNSWNDNIHLFINDLKETEIDLISNFYAKASYIDIMIRKISDWKTQPKIPTTIMSPVSIQSQPSATAQPIPSVPEKKEIVYFFDPMEETQKILYEVSMNVEFIFNTPVVEKLRKIVSKKWYDFI